MNPENPDAKLPWQSLTIWSGLIAAVLAALTAIGVTVPDWVPGMAPAVVQALLTLAGIVVAVVGHWRATATLAGTPAAQKGRATTLPSWAILAGFLTISAISVISGGCASQATPTTEANRGDNESSGITLNINVLSAGRSPNAATPGLPGTPQGVASVNAATQPSDPAGSGAHKVFETATGNTISLTVTVNPSQSGTATASQASTASPSQTQTPTVQTTANVPISGGGSAGTTGTSAAPATSQAAPNGATQTTTPPPPAPATQPAN